MEQVRMLKGGAVEIYCSSPFLTGLRRLIGLTGSKNFFIYKIVINPLNMLQFYVRFHVRAAH